MNRRDFLKALGLSTASATKKLNLGLVFYCGIVFNPVFNVIRVLCLSR
jgi:hypothetical protein